MITTVWLLLLVLQLLLLVFAAFYLYADIRLGVAAVPSSTRAVCTVSELLPRFPGETVVDLGSGWGGLALAAARACPQKKIIGLELAALPYTWSEMRRRLFHPTLKNIRFLKEDIFDFDLSAVNIVFCYMPPELMPRLRAKLAELPKGSIVISNSATFDDMTPIETHDLEGVLPEQLFIYRIA